MSTQCVLAQPLVDLIRSMYARVIESWITREMNRARTIDITVFEEVYRCSGYAKMMNQCYLRTFSNIIVIFNKWQMLYSHRLPRKAKPRSQLLRVIWIFLFFPLFCFNKCWGFAALSQTTDGSTGLDPNGNHQMYGDSSFPVLHLYKCCSTRVSHFPS